MIVVLSKSTQRREGNINIGETFLNLCLKAPPKGETDLQADQYYIPLQIMGKF
jgi:hypothetical protein